MTRLGIVLGVVAAIAGYIGISMLLARLIQPEENILAVGLALAYCGIPLYIGAIFYGIIKGLVMLIIWIVIGDRKIVKQEIIDEDLISAQQELDEEYPGM